MSNWPGWVKAVIEAMPTDRETYAPASTIPPHLFKLWVILGRYANNETGECWPSLTTLALRSGCDRRNLLRYLSVGEELGLWTRGRATGGSRNTTRYTVRRLGLGVQTPLITRGTDTPTTRGKYATQLGVNTPPRTKPENKAITSVKKPRAKRPVSSKPKGRKSNPSKAVAATFQTTDGQWHLTAGQRDKLRDTYPFVHIDTELTGLADWTEANPDKRKKPGAMHGWLRRLMASKQAERPLPTAAFYADGFQHACLPTDPTPEQLDKILGDDDADYD